MGSDESHLNVSLGSDGQSHRRVSTNHNLFEEKGEPKRYGTEVLPLTALPLGYTGSLVRMYLWWSWCTLYLHACQMRVTLGDSGLCCCTCVTYFKCQLTPLCVDSYPRLVSLWNVLLHALSPWYNCHGWLGIKNSVIYIWCLLVN